jgi:excisionase family DNA binding protein
MCEDRLYTFKEAAALLAIPESTLRKKAAAGLVPHRHVFRHTRFSAQDLRDIQSPSARPRSTPSRARREPI